ncbi:MAG: serine/threonine-protein kinase [Candidatus Melainabacteria bacterium]|nr:serine/threonine-protein kinase [Candidatus Melainabacteria bacterium]
MSTSVTKNENESDHALAGRYELIKCLANHGTCSVYKANDQTMKRPVAVKVLTEQIMSDEELRRFHRGALAACSVKHENCVQMFNFGTTPDERPYMVMEFVNGSTLRKIVQDNGPLSATDAIAIALQICDGLSAIHANNIVHRDLKTANVMVDGFDRRTPVTKILDFGLAKPANAGHSSKPITKAGQIVGSPVYMSPEQVKGLDLDPRTDIYSLGCILFEMLTGDPLFLGKTSMQTMHMHVTMPPPTLAIAAPRKFFPQVLEDIIARAVAKDPNDRYQTALEMKDELLEAVESLEQYDQLGKTTETLGTRTRRAPKWLLIMLFVLSMACLAIGVGILGYLSRMHLL